MSTHSVSTIPTIVLIAVVFGARTNAFQLTRSCRSLFSAKQLNFAHPTTYHLQQSSASFASLTSALSVTNDVETDDEVFAKRTQLYSWLSDYEKLSFMLPVELELLTQIMKERKLKKGDILPRGSASEFFIISHGTFYSYEDDEEGNEIFFPHVPGEALDSTTHGNKVKVVSDEASYWYIEPKMLNDLFNIRRGSGRRSPQKKNGMFSGLSDILKQRSTNDAVSRCDIFDKLTEGDKKAVADKLVLVEGLSKGTLLCSEGEDLSNPDLFIIQDGIFEAYKSNNPAKVLMKYVNTGYFGELSVLLNQPRSACVRVVSNNAKVYTLCRKDLIEATKQSILQKVAKAQLLAALGDSSISVGIRLTQNYD